MLVPESNHTLYVDAHNAAVKIPHGHEGGTSQTLSCSPSLEKRCAADPDSFIYHGSGGGGGGDGRVGIQAQWIYCAQWNHTA